MTTCTCRKSWHEPTNKIEALMEGSYCKPCEKRGSWRARRENGQCRCEAEYRVRAERLLLAREAQWTN